MTRGRDSATRPCRGDGRVPELTRPPVEGSRRAEGARTRHRTTRGGLLPAPAAWPRRGRLCRRCQSPCADGDADRADCDVDGRRSQPAVVVMGRVCATVSAIEASTRQGRQADRMARRRLARPRVRPTSSSDESAILCPSAIPSDTTCGAPKSVASAPVIRGPRLLAGITSMYMLDLHVL